MTTRSKLVFEAFLLIAAIPLSAAPPVRIMTHSVPGGTVGQAYAATLSVTGGMMPYSWSVDSGQLPEGLALSSGGTISGSPTSTGPSNFKVKVVDSKDDSDTQALSIVVSPGVTITTSSLPAGQVGASYSQPLRASGGMAPYTWSISAGALPPGLSLSAAQIAGTPTSAGTANFTVQVVDKNSLSATQALSINVSAGPVSITTGPLPNGQAGIAYSQTLQASGGTGAYTWSLTSGSLPAGLNLSGSGQIAGTPTSAGNTSFTITVNDTGSGSATRALFISVSTASVPVSIPTSSLPGGEIGIAYSQTLQATGGTAPYRWSITSGGTPAGLSLTTAGKISGIPIFATTATFTVNVSDSAGASATAPLSITIALAVTAAACPATSGPAGQLYSATLSASNGTPPYTWALASGQLPPGLSILASGQISGTPTTPGSFSFGAKVTDQNSASATTTCAVTITVPPLSISTASLPGGTSGSSYSQAVAAIGGQPPYTWAISGGALPPGLALSGGQISGTSTTSGTFQFTLRVTDAAGTSVTKDFAIQIVTALTVVTSSLGALKTGVSSSQQLSASGGVPPYTWAVSAGSLPPGSTLSNSGAIAGTPSTAGTFGFTVRVTDSASATAQQAFTLTVAPSLAISSCPAANAIQGQSYSSTPAATGGQAPYTWTLAAGTLPSGLVFTAASGGISGNPADAGSYPFTLLVADKASVTATRDCILTVASSLAIVTTVLSDASPSATYSQTLIATGGKVPYSWSIVSGNLPSGLTLSGAGVISGSTAQVGSFSFAVRVVDANSATAQQNLSINVVFGLVVGSCPTGTAEVGLAYSFQMVASGGIPPYNWSLTAGSLPQGLSLDAVSGAITGTPQQAGTIQFTLNARDANGNANKQCSIGVQPALAISGALSNGISGTMYTDAIVNTGGVAPFVWSTTAGSLPPGLSLNQASGQITGTPLVPGTFNFTARVADALGGQVTKDLSISIVQGLTIQDCPAPAGVIGQPYSSALTAVGGAVPYAWKIDSGALPPGLTLSSANSIISGVPLQAGQSSFVLHVDDSAGKSTTRLCSIQINTASLTITSAVPLPGGQMGTPYSQTLSATGGRAPYLWSITSGAPSGFSLSSAGVLTGVPSTPGVFTFTVQVTDQDNNVAQQSVTLTILAGKAPNVTITGLPDIVDPAQQPTFALQLDTAYPSAINGTLTLVFTPDPAVGIDDPAVQFATGGRVLNFTVPSASTQVAWSAPVVAFQTGTVAGTIDLNVQLQSNGTDISPASPTVRTVRVDRLAPRIVSVNVVQTSTGFDVHLIGFATTREVTQGIFQFSGNGVSPISVTVPLDSFSKPWFQSAGSAQFGGQFGLVQSFLWQGQPTGTLSSVSVSLTNAQGTSGAAQGNF